MKNIRKQQIDKNGMINYIPALLSLLIQNPIKIEKPHQKKHGAAFVELFFITIVTGDRVWVNT
jgi:hypothetical protein